MKSPLTKIIILCALAALVTFGWYHWSSDVEQRLVKSRSNGTSVLVINVLSADQFNDCHIRGSINVPFEQLNSFMQGIDHDTELIFYCSNYMCTGSGAAAKLFKDKGFKKVWAYEAGMADWYQKGLPVEGPCKSGYLFKSNQPIENPDKEVAAIDALGLKEKLGI